MKDFDLEKLKKILESIGINNLKSFIIEDKIEFRFNEGTLIFNIDSTKNSFQIQSFNIYSTHRFKPETSFKAISEEIIENIRNYCKQLNYSSIEALNIRNDAIKFWKRMNFQLDNNEKNGILILN